MTRCVLSRCPQREEVCSQDRNKQDNLPQITSLDAFFQATEMHFHKDISGFAGVDLTNKSRKSMVPQMDGRERASCSHTNVIASLC